MLENEIRLNYRLGRDQSLKRKRSVQQIIDDSNKDPTDILDKLRVSSFEKNIEKIMN